MKKAALLLAVIIKPCRISATRFFLNSIKVEVDQSHLAIQVDEGILFLNY